MLAPAAGRNCERTELDDAVKRAWGCDGVVDDVDVEAVDDVEVDEVVVGVVEVGVGVVVDVVAVDVRRNDDAFVGNVVVAVATHIDERKGATARKKMREADVNDVGVGHKKQAVEEGSVACGAVVKNVVKEQHVEMIKLAKDAPK
ncbi:hypothetical protein FGB62_22g523 [Gracilaria domingensis]|nr:hypothetical protein FGB62_22g523 [Gracilaria domingensis]